MVLGQIGLCMNIALKRENVTIIPACRYNLVLFHLLFGPFLTDMFNMYVYLYSRGSLFVNGGYFVGYFHALPRSVRDKLHKFRT